MTYLFRSKLIVFNVCRKGGPGGGGGPGGFGGGPGDDININRIFHLLILNSK